ncbi:MAG: ParB/RepB/Spo0J family partition protein [Nostocaceae cyanobacterium]|nr:ParB/RepB/Spo0J family partition protein [Nostocaceae cyanobacterium]
MPPKKPLVPPTMRGVSDLLSMDAEGEQATTTAPVDKIKVNPNQPRRYFDPEKMAQLVQSVREFGILEPLLVRSLSDGYELVAGERRLRAAVELGLTEVPIVSKELSDRQALQVALLENLQREDLNPVEETEGILELLSRELDTSTKDVVSILNQGANAKKRGLELADNVVRQLEIVESLLSGIGRFSADSFRTGRLPLLNLSQDVLEALRQGKLEYTKARAIALVKNDEQRAVVLEKAIAEDMSLTEIKRLIQEMRSPETVTATVNLSERYSDIGKRLKSAKVWDDAKKRKKLEKLLSDLEQLLS